MGTNTNFGWVTPLGGEKSACPTIAQALSRSCHFYPDRSEVQRATAHLPGVEDICSTHNASKGDHSESSDTHSVSIRRQKKSRQKTRPKKKRTGGPSQAGLVAELAEIGRIFCEHNVSMDETSGLS